jgi:signal transduction histidine kinase
MPLTSPSLKNFIDLVPLVPHTAQLEALRSIFSQGNCDRVAVVNEQLHPLGLVYLRSLMPLADQVSDWQQPLCEMSLPTLTPLRIVPADLSVSEFWQYLQARELNPKTANQQNWSDTARQSQTGSSSLESPIALTNSDGQFLGMLDSMRLLQFAAINHSSIVREIDPESALKAQPTAVREIAYEPMQAAIETALDAQVRFLEAGLKPSEHLNSLVQLLEKLPLPLRLQTPTGQIVSQNAAWRILLGAGPEPVPEPAAHLGTPSPSKPTSLTTEYQSVNTKALTHECRSLVGVARVSDRDSTRDATAATSCPLPLYAAASPSTLTAPAWCPIAGKPDTYVCDCPVQKGQERIWQFVKQPLSDNLILVMGQDVTEEHLVAKELAAKNTDLIHLNRLKDEFLSCISHELKTPLTAVLGLSSLLKDKLIGELNDRQTRYAKLIHQSGRHLMTIVNDILDLTRMETGQLELIPELVEITATCNKAFEQAKQLQQQEEKAPSQSNKTPGTSPQESTSKIEFTLEIEPGLTHLIADELRLRQMLVNLLSNALKFTEIGGKIGLKVNMWEGWLAFTVWDTGIGIPADKQHLIFQKFQQLESPLTRRFQGTGLGLVLTQRLARLHGGDVSFISSENQGSQFTLLLPPHPPGTSWEDSAESTTVQAPDFLKPKFPCPIANSRSRLILIVEAVPKYIEDLTKVLTSLGYQVQSRSHLPQSAAAPAVRLGRADVAQKRSRYSIDPSDYHSYQRRKRTGLCQPCRRLFEPACHRTCFAATAYRLDSSARFPCRQCEKFFDYLVAKPAEQFLSRFVFIAKPHLLPGFRSRRHRPSRTRRPHLATRCYRFRRYESTKKPLSVYPTVKFVSQFGFSPLSNFRPRNYATGKSSQRTVGISVFGCRGYRGKWNLRYSFGGICFVASYSSSCGHELEAQHFICRHFDFTRLAANCRGKCRDGRNRK